MNCYCLKTRGQGQGLLISSTFFFFKFLEGHISPHKGQALSKPTFSMRPQGVLFLRLITGLFLTRSWMRLQISVLNPKLMNSQTEQIWPPTRCVFQIISTLIRPCLFGKLSASGFGQPSLSVSVLWCQIGGVWGVRDPFLCLCSWQSKTCTTWVLIYWFVLGLIGPNCISTLRQNTFVVNSVLIHWDYQSYNNSNSLHT